MNFFLTFIQRPIGTTLIALAIGLSGMLAYGLLPISPLPQIEFPTISIQSSLPGSSPEIMATSVATPLERELGRIAGVREITSSSSLGSSNIIIQFDLNRDINGAARDVQAGIISARSNLPTNLPVQPSYRIVNPSDAPIFIIALTSPNHSAGQMYDMASTVLSQKISQINGVGQVVVGGSSLPSSRIDVNPYQLNHHGLSLEDVRSTLSAVNSNFPKGQINTKDHTFEITSNDQLFKAKEYLPLIINYQNGAAIRIADIADVHDSVEDIHNAGLFKGKTAIVLIIFKTPGSNIIETVDEIYKTLPYLKTTVPEAVDLNIVMDRTTTIKSSLREVKFTLILAIFLVIGVIYQFIGNFRASLVTSIAVPLSLLGTFSIMYLLDYSLDNLSLMALIVATGFVVDDAVVVVENISRHIEEGKKAFDAAILGVQEVSFTVISMSLSLIAVFIPIILMGGMIGRLFREFAISLSIAILVSMLISLTITPMMSAYILSAKKEDNKKITFMAPLLSVLKQKYATSLQWALNQERLMHFITIGVIALNIFLFWLIPKGFFPQQDTGRITGSIQAEQNISFNHLKNKFIKFEDIIQKDPAVDNVVGIIGGNSTTTGNSGRMYITLKKLEERKGEFVDDVIKRLRKKLAVIPGAVLYMKAAQDLVIGGRSNNAQYQYTLTSFDLHSLNLWAPRLVEEFEKVKGVVDVNSDQLDHGLETFVTIDRDRAYSLGVSAKDIDNALYDAFGQRQVSTVYTALNQYHVVMSVGEKFWKDPNILDNFYVKSNKGHQIPFSSFAKFKNQSTLLVVNHQSLLPATTISFNLLPGYSLGYAVEKMEGATKKIGLPANLITGSFQGTAQAFQDSLSSEPYLILAAILAIYIVLGILYESMRHPLTILSTLPSAGVGALLALILTGQELNIIGLIGILLLIGIVKKNAIMIIDFAIVIQRTENKPAKLAIFEGALLRFRPILMTTMSALFSALPLALGTSIGVELRRPLGISIVGGLIVSQLMTLYTTPIVYLTFERLGKCWKTKNLKTETA